MMMGESPAVFPSIICQNGFYLQSLLLIEGQYVVMKDEGSMVGEFACVEITKGKGAIGIYDRLHIDFSNILAFACIEDVLGRELGFPHAFP